MNAMTTTAPATDRAENDRLGVITGPREITFTRLLPGPRQRVWDFLVDSEKRGRWLASGEMEPRVGGTFVRRFHNAAITPAGETIPAGRECHAGPIEQSGTVTAFEPTSRVAFSWGEASEVEFTLADADDGRVRLTLVHRNLPTRGEMKNVSGGWHAHIGLLVDILEDRAPTVFWGKIAELEPIYDAAIPAD